MVCEDRSRRRVCVCFLWRSWRRRHSMWGRWIWGCLRLRTRHVWMNNRGRGRGRRLHLCHIKLVRERRRVKKEWKNVPPPYSGCGCAYWFGIAIFAFTSSHSEVQERYNNVIEVSKYVRKELLRLAQSINRRSRFANEA